MMAADKQTSVRLSWPAGSDPGPFFENLNADQREAVIFQGAPLLVLAGAGSGKTRVLTSKIAWLATEGGIPPWRIMAATFTNKAAREMKDRVASLLGRKALEAQVSTFHSFGLRMLFRNRDELLNRGYQRNFVVFDRADSMSLVKKILKKMDIGNLKQDPSWYVDRISKLKTFPELEENEPEIPLQVYRQYLLSMKEQGAFDFDDLILMPLHLLRTDPSILERERARQDWIMVDEYQDVNRSQFELMKLLVGDSKNVMAVGDPDQSIYGWRGADISVILDFEKHFPGAKVILLEQNYRSTGTILHAANAVIACNVHRHEKKLWTERPEGEPIVVAWLNDERSEARYVADKVESLAEQGYDYSDVAVLYRINALSRNLEQEFISRTIPYRIVKGTAFYDRKEVKDVLSYLRLAVNPKDGASLARVANVPSRGIGDKSLAALSDFIAGGEADPRTLWGKIANGACPLRGKAKAGAADLAEHMLSLLSMDGRMTDLVSYILDAVEYESLLKAEYPGQWEERRENVMELASLEVESGKLEDVLAEISLYTDQEVENKGSGVNMLSLHGAKGLEFPVVIVVGMEDGLFPHSRAMIDAASDELEEERRLWYVGMTRAEERLYATGAWFRRIFGNVIRNDVSRFIAEIPQQYMQIEDFGEEDFPRVRFGFKRRYRSR